MASHSSASLREENLTASTLLLNAALDYSSPIVRYQDKRARLIRYALEIKDPYLAQVVRRVESGDHRPRAA